MVENAPKANIIDFPVSESVLNTEQVEDETADLTSLQQYRLEKLIRSLGRFGWVAEHVEIGDHL